MVGDPGCDGASPSVPNCSRPVREADAEELGWRYWSDGVDLHLICALCATASSALIRQLRPNDRERRRPCKSFGRFILRGVVIALALLLLLIVAFSLYLYSFAPET